MVYITGDTHGEGNWGEGDIIIVCGDFGYLFLNDSYENVYLNELQKRAYTICFVDGNHENFSAICEYPCETWNGGKIHRIRNNIIHLMRGQIFNIQGSSYFTMGGAYSIDRAMRRLGYSYWAEELPNNEEYKEATINLKNVGMKVDYIITHTAPQRIIRQMGYYPDLHDMELTGFLEWVMCSVKFKKWFFGHFHEDEEINAQFQSLLFSVKKI